VTQATIERIGVLKEAIAIEKAGGDWSLKHVLAVLGCSKSTLYRNKWLMSKKIDLPGGPAWHPSDIRFFQAQRQGIMRPSRKKAS
jgi:hypothetical protein